MNAPHLHLLLNHFPVFGTLFGLLILAGGFLLKNGTVKNVAYGVFIFTALTSIPAYLSGGQAEEALENTSGISKVYIEKHEELAEVAIWLVELLGIFAAISLVMSVKDKPYQKYLAIITLLFSLVTFGWMAKLNNAGGEIRHTEIRKGYSAESQNPESKPDDD